jgi:hypothetical protein
LGCGDEQEQREAKPIGAVVLDIDGTLQDSNDAHAR